MIIRKVMISAVSERYEIRDLHEGDLRLLADICAKAATHYNGDPAGMVLRLSDILQDAATTTANLGVRYVSGSRDAERMFTKASKANG